MRVVLWTSVIIGVTVAVFISAVVTALVLYLRTLNDKNAVEDTETQDTGKNVISFLGIGKKAGYGNHALDKTVDWVKTAMKYGVPVLTDLTSFKDMPFKIDEKPLNFTQIAGQLGYTCLEYEVQTKDGYLLTLFRVKGTSMPVLLIHGFLDSADTFILRGSGSLVGALAAAGSDVWVANLRGNKYSRRHATLNPDTDKSFWEFSFHEQGKYDLPSIIDFVLTETGQNRLQTVSHSLGSTVFFVMSSTLPEYNSKIQLLVSMAPICHLDNIQTPLSNLMLGESIINILLRTIGKKEVFGSYSQFLPILKKLCSFGFIGSEICLEGGIFYVFGRNAEGVKADFIPLLSAHYPAGTSVKNVNHVAQLHIRKSFSQYDYGYVGNMMEYVSLWPPRYDLSKVSTKTALFVTRNDKVSTWKDAELLRRELPNVAEYNVVNRRKFNHIDYVWGQNANKYLYPQIIEVLRKYKD